MTRNEFLTCLKQSNTQNEILVLLDRLEEDSLLCYELFNTRVDDVMKNLRKILVNVLKSHYFPTIVDYYPIGRKIDLASNGKMYKDCIVVGYRDRRIYVLSQDKEILTFRV